MGNFDWQFQKLNRQGAITGGNAAEFAFGERNLTTLAREVIQNSFDQDLGEDPVRISFDFIELSGKQRDAFQKAIYWEHLLTHIDGVCDQDFPSVERFKREREELAATNRGLRLLRITDSSTKGLIGPEKSQPGQTDGNFASLCKNQLTNQSDSGGGSYGLGKAVLWLFSGIGSVLFFSDLSEPQNQGSRRLFGRANFPYHMTEQDGKISEWEGPGWFGELDTEGIACSIWEADDQILNDLCINRSSNIETGTTALILDFDEPDRSEDRPLVEVAASLREEIQRNYWPLLLQGNLEVDVSVTEHENTDYSIDIREPDLPELAPFVDAWKMSQEKCADTFSGNVDEVIHKSIIVNVPERHGKNPAPATEVEATLRLISYAKVDENNVYANHIALVRGAGMVVEYKSFPTPLDLDYSVCGFFAAGLTGRGFGHGGHKRDKLTKSERNKNNCLEQFLRAAEPPAHNKWKHDEPRCKALFPRLAAKNLDLLWKDIKDCLRTAVYKEIEGEGLKNIGLSKLLRFAAAGTTDPEGKMTHSVNHMELVDGSWQLEGKVFNSKPDGEWSAKLSTFFQLDGGGKEDLFISSLIVDGHSIDTFSDGAVFTTSKKSVKFTLTTNPDTEYSDLISEVPIALSVDKTIRVGS